MVTQLQRARDCRRICESYNDSIAFEFFISGIGCFVFSLVVLFYLPNNTPPLVVAPILFFGLIMGGISVLALLYMIYIELAKERLMEE